MYLYHLTLQKQSAINVSIFGNFSAPRVQELVVARGSILELLRVEADGKLKSIASVDVFGAIRSLMPFRLTGSNVDYVVVGSDAGRITILEFDGDKSMFKKVHRETFGRSGCRRIVPGEHLAADPRGRAVMIAAMEKQKFVYILNRDSSARLTISSPLESHKAHTVTFHVVGVDVGFENPQFAALEVEYSELEEGEEYEKMLTFYELDLGLNHLVRKDSTPVHARSNHLVAVPGGADGPGGVLVCAEDMVSWRHIEGGADVCVPLPRCEGTDDAAPILITASTTHKRKGVFFFLLQSEHGDLYKVTMDYEKGEVRGLDVVYFDTVPVGAAINMLRLGFLFVAAENGNHVLYQFQSLGDDDDGSVVRRTRERVYFKRRPLQNLVLIDEIESLHPLTDLTVKDLAREGTPQLYALGGCKRNAATRVLRHGLPMAEMAVSELPANPTAVWTVKRTAADEFDTYMVVAFVNATLVLSIGDTVEEVSEAQSGFFGTARTIAVHQIGDDSVLQVLPSGLRNIRADKRVNEWRAPANKVIEHAAVNSHQIVIALGGGELYYFEVDPSGQFSEVAKKEVGRNVLCLDMSPVPENRRRARYLAIGDADTVRVLSLDPDNCMQSLALQSVPSPPSSLALIEMQCEAERNARGTLFLNIGLQDGVLLRTVLDNITGELTDTRRRFLGPRPVKLSKITVQGEPALLALSARPWLCYAFQNKLHLSPLSYMRLDSAASFCSEQCSEGVVAISGGTLRIIVTERLGELFHQSELPLSYTPRKVVDVTDSDRSLLVSIEAEHRTVSETRRVEAGGAMEVEAHAAGEEDEDEVNWEYEQKIVPPTGAIGSWASCIRLFDPTENETLQLIELQDDEAAVTICTCTFAARRGETFVVVGTVKSLVPAPRSHSGGVLHVYVIGSDDNGASMLQFVHKTEVEDVPGALCPFQGRILVGVGKLLRIYDLGKKKMLRKCENKSFPSMVRSILTQGDRIIVGCIAHSVLFAKYSRGENLIHIFADDVAPRWITTCCFLDFDTIAGGDKFGNVFILRLPKEVSEEAEVDRTGAFLKMNQGILNAAPHKLVQQAQIHVGSAVTSLQRTALIPGSNELLLYTTISGAVGVLVPFVSREDVDFFSHLEMHMRQENPPLCGRDHLSYRSYYFPVKDVIDGDLCEQYGSMKADVKYRVAEELDRKPSEVMKKLEDIRNRCL
eukprot:TRINITY_DN1564_c0_g1_i10.p1 TRINITY_DN1564_c0_g1~~TRINITY_DN1564_c0_g1_i10.p1  ORF type:complete len:1192 (-),score=452.93 TRINITY_DN1564_c0_g1_i10:363-3938(-)